MNCDHKTVIWRAMPYDWDKGGAYYALFCVCCGEKLGAECFTPGTFDPFKIGIPNNVLDDSDNIS